MPLKGLLKNLVGLRALKSLMRPWGAEPYKTLGPYMARLKGHIKSHSGSKKNVSMLLPIAACSHCQRVTESHTTALESTSFLHVSKRAFQIGWPECFTSTSMFNLAMGVQAVKGTSQHMARDMIGRNHKWLYSFSSGAIIIGSQP